MVIPVLTEKSKAFLDAIDFTPYFQKYRGLDGYYFHAMIARDLIPSFNEAGLDEVEDFCFGLGTFRKYLRERYGDYYMLEDE